MSDVIESKLPELEELIDSAIAHPAARERRRRQVVAGGYMLRAAATPSATIVAMGALVPEALAASERLAAQGTPVDVVCVTSPGLLYEALQGRNGQNQDAPSWILDQILPSERAVPMVTVLDGHPHTLAFLANVHQVRSRNLGVDTFGQAGGIDDVYRYHGVDTDSIVRAVLDLVR
ncbi:transketolase-like TK C-terminal-containing protein [Paenarthrobacter nitroguajacolicus]|uniref:transketolase-like TK C-terminal-containing protein n=1 Tax=Paenarthrobacter nitroguajacolicus TaxID=211146 RepID=UPI002119A711|nr:hypothetical protein [Paenarthrobacter nitroguajacolicus]